MLKAQKYSNKTIEEKNLANLKEMPIKIQDTYRVLNEVDKKRKCLSHMINKN